MLALPRIIAHGVGTSSVHRVRRMFGVRHQTKNYALYFACQVSFLESTSNLKCGGRTVFLLLEISYTSNHLSSMVPLKRRACVLTQLPWLPRAPLRYARNVLGEKEETKQCSEACATTLRTPSQPSAAVPTSTWAIISRACHEIRAMASRNNCKANLTASK